MDRELLYSRFVSWSKVLLPLAALALLSTMFLFSWEPQGNSDIPVAELEEIARQPRIADPSFAGVAEDGSVIAIAAEVLRPVADRLDTFVIEELRATIDAPDGTGVEIRAGSGEIDGPARIARFEGLARLSTTSGFEMETSGLVANLASGEVRSLGPLEVRSPFGSLTAGELAVRDGADGYTLLFTGGVRLLYRPGTEE